MVKQGLRPIDLARAAGLSTQQVRNYVDAGILPPTPRTPSGYRTFSERHRTALLTFRALVRGHGRDVAESIMLAVHAADVPRALELLDESHAALHEQRQQLEATGTALAAVAESPTDTRTPQVLRIGELAGHLRIRTSALRVWEAAGLLTPERERNTGYRLYRQQDIRDARMINMLRQSRYPLPQIGPVLASLRRTGSSEALRAAIASRRTELTTRATAMLEAAHHLHTYTT